MNLIGPVVLLLATAATAQEDTVKLSKTDGTYVRLKDLFRSRPTVLFYEDKDSTRVNQPLKDALFAAGKAKGMLDSVTVVAVANVASFDWFPARNIVTAAVRNSERTYGIPIYLDWTGELTKPPWSLQPDKSTVVLLDRAGRVLSSKQGMLGQGEIDQVLSRLAALVEVE